MNNTKPNENTMTNTIKTEQVVIRLTERDKRKLRAIKQFKGISQSEYIRGIINNAYRQLKDREGFNRIE